jgi:hypothetical protein
MRRVGDESGDALLMSLTGSSPNDMEEGVVSKGSGLSRGDKRRNAKLAELRRLVPADHVIVGIDLADKKQAVVVCDHDSQVLARKTVKARACEVPQVLFLVGCEGRGWLARGV